MQSPRISRQQIHELADGSYIERAEPVIFIGDRATGASAFELFLGSMVAATPCSRLPSCTD